MNTLAVTAIFLLRSASRALPGLAILLVTGIAMLLNSTTDALAGVPMGLVARPDSGVTIRVEQLYKDLPPMGYAPIRVYIKNGSQYTQTWKITTTHGTHGQDGRSLRSTQTLSVDSNREGEFLVLAPLLPRADAGQIYGSSANLSVQMSGYGMDESSDPWDNKGRPGTPSGSSYSRRAELPFLLLSEKYVSDSWKLLATAMPNLDGSSVEPKDWPADYRAYMGAYAVFISREDWQALRPEQRQALQQWVMQGGHLYICWPEASDAGLATLVANRTAPGAWGAGTIRAMEAKDTLAADKVRKALQPAQDPRYWSQERVNTTNSYGSSNNEEDDRAIAKDVPVTVKFGAVEGLSAPEIPRGLILLFVLAFSILVGPVNLFYLAPVSKRYRLFWTTPLISVAASIFLMALIFLSEGIGGIGNRVVATLLLPDDRKSIVIQEQASRTAVLFYPNFTLPQTGSLQQLKLSGNNTDDDGNPYSRRSSTTSSMDKSFYITNQGNTAQYSGAWFAGRALQAQWMQVMEDSRQQITLMNPAEVGDGIAPVLLSQVSPTLRQVYFRDRNGKVWNCENLGSGQKLTCKASTEQALKDYLNAAKDKFGRRLKAMYADTENNRGWFYANTGESHEQPMETLSGIRWTNTGHYFLGSVSGAAPLTASINPGAATSPASITTSGSSDASTATAGSNTRTN
ncbi:MAG: hypothetical protein ACAI35_05695 [Candidatus Methylacidiphilales bacterium]|nr:hypothetical protein [Candidatus Methylacidiphilales bacterium]